MAPGTSLGFLTDNDHDRAHQRTAGDGLDRDPNDSPASQMDTSPSRDRLAWTDPIDTEATCWRCRTLRRSSRPNNSYGRPKATVGRDVRPSTRIGHRTLAPKNCAIATIVRGRVVLQPTPAGRAVVPGRSPSSRWERTR